MYGMSEGIKQLKHSTRLINIMALIYHKLSHHRIPITYISVNYYNWDKRVHMCELYKIVEFVVVYVIKKRFSLFTLLTMSLS